MTTTITIEALELLATEFEHDCATTRSRLERLCVAYARILSAREPKRFDPCACHEGDEAGHYDNSFPPDIEYSDHTGPRAIILANSVTEDVATSGGFYYSWRRVTSRGALVIGRRGEWYRSDETGTGRVGQFAAFPGDCSVDVTIEYNVVDGDDLSIEELESAEAKLRALAFPLVAAKLAAEVSP